MNELLYAFGNVVNILSVLVSIVSALIGIFSWYKAKKKDDNKKWKLIGCLAAGGVVFCVLVLLYANSLVEVPTLQGKIYYDAKNILIEHGLDFNTVQGHENGIVTEQAPEAGKKVTKGTKVLMIVEPNTTPTNTSVPTPTATNTPTPEPTDTPAPTATNTPEPTPTDTPVPTATNTPVPTPTATNTPTPTPHVHDYSWRVKTTKEATCTSEGKKEHVCVCGDYWTETIPMREHSLVTDKAVAATCVATGKTEGSHCSICKYVSVEQKVIPMTDHKYSDESDAYCDYCNAYRATWHYYDQWNNSVYGDWELYKTESEEKVKEKSVTTYTYVVYYWVDPTRIGDERYRATGSRLLPENYEFNKYLTGKESSNYAGITTGTDTYITKDTNKKYNIRQSEIFYSPQTYRYEDPWIIDGIEYWEEIQGSEKQEEKYTEYHYFFRKFY